MHLKRNEVPKIWPIERKGSTYVVRPINNLSKGLPLLIALRDVLKIGKTRKEIEKILNFGKVKVNNRKTSDEKRALTLFDILSLDSQHYKLILKDKKIAFEEVKGKESETKIAKVIGKKLIKEGKIQINLNDGRNYLLKEKVKTGDSVLINLKENNIVSVIPFKENAKILFTSGSHIGEEGKVDKIDGKNIIISAGKEKINAKLENLMVI